MPSVQKIPQGFLVTALGLAIVMIIVLGAVFLKVRQGEEGQNKKMAPEIIEQVETTPTVSPTAIPTGFQPSAAVSIQLEQETQLENDLQSIEKDSVKLDEEFKKVDQGLNDQPDNLNE